MRTLDRSEKALAPGQGERVEQRIVIRSTPAELYRLWQDLEVMGRVFEHVDSISSLPGGRSHWVVKGPAGCLLEWDAEVVHQKEAEHIGWQALPGGDVAAAGSVHFHPRAGGTTELIVVLRYDPPGGVVGSWIASILGADPARRIAEDLERFRQQVESGAAAARDSVDVASEESFPASDPPGWTAR